MIRAAENIFILGTKNTTYMFQVLPTGHLEHLYYGKTLGDYAAASVDQMRSDAEALSEKRAFAAGNMISYSSDAPQVTLEDLRLEMSSCGKGDIREPFVEVIHADGSRTSDFLFDSYEITEGKTDFVTLPGSYASEAGESAPAVNVSETGASNQTSIVSDSGGTGNSCKDGDSGRKRSSSVQHLTVCLKDAQYRLKLELHYYVFEDCDVISRSSRLINESEEQVRLERLMSTQIDFEEAGFVFTNFHGAWAREMNRNDTVLRAGKFVNASFTGSSSNRANPFIMVSRETTTEDAGDCYGMNLIYSGNHCEVAEVNAFGKTRVQSGINPQGFSWLLPPGDAFEAPEAVMAYSDQGYTGMSRCMHAFVRNHIVRGAWKNKVRPVLLNSWEAAYFKIDEAKLLRLAKAGKEAGIELFVMDDGWFGEREDDTSSLGDWEVNAKKLPGGLKQLSDKIHNLGMLFGIWIEPEMVNVKSRLYAAHPEWVMEIPGKPHAEGRTQRILDFANPAVVDYMAEQMKNVLSSAQIDYVKWDMNRIMSDIYSPCLSAEQQGETAHRYILGVYRLMKELTESFPHILFEGCAAGGNRFDLGVLCYFPQIWASDDTDAVQRATIQQGYSYGYPMSVVSAHVSACPNHQTLRSVPMETRFAVAAFGVLGYELNLCDLNRKEMEEIQKQIELYKQWREVLQYGSFYRGRSGNLHEWTCVSPDQKKAVGMIMQEKTIPNTQFEQYRAKGLDPERRYHFYNIEEKHDIRKFGDLVNTQAPVHVKTGSVLHNAIAQFVTMPGEKEDIRTSGALLMRAGIKLHQAYSATGYDENTRYFSDYCSRLYFMDAVDE